MIRRLLMVGGVLTAVLVPIGIAAASTTEDGISSVDAPAEVEATDLQQVNPNCDGTCDGAGPGVGPRNGSGPIHVGPANGTGNQFGRDGGQGNRHGAGGQAGFGIGPRDGTGPIHVGPADGTGNRFGVAAGIRNPDDGVACDGTRRHAPNATESSS
jgi:hypothetical protein